MTLNILYSRNYSGVVTVGIYTTDSDPVYDEYYAESNINVGIITASTANVTNIGATSISVENISCTGILTAPNINVSTSIGSSSIKVVGIITATDGFISVANTTPIQITLLGNLLTFTAAGIGSTTLTLS